MFVESAIIIACSFAIYHFGNAFAAASNRIGEHFALPKGVKGATLDAVSSSLPELMVALFAVIFFGSFDIGVATIAGSAAFNLLIIPAAAALVAPAALRVGGHVLDRDGVFFFISLLLLTATLWYTSSWGVWIALLFLGVYAVYVQRFITHAKENTTAKHVKTSLSRDTLILLVTATGIAGASYFLVQQAISLAHALGVHPTLIAFTVIAAATSVPDMVVSLANARQGSGDDALSNALGSNTFNILVGLPIPILAYVLLTGQPVALVFANTEILFGLLAATLVLVLTVANGKDLTKRNGVFLLAVYAAFIIYVFFFSL